MPPDTPRTMFMVQLAVGSWQLAVVSSCQPPTANCLLVLQRRRLVHRRRQLPLDDVLLDFFHGHARGLGVTALGARLRSLNQLLRALGHQQHVAELAVNSFGQSFHCDPLLSIARPSGGWLRARSWSAASWRSRPPSNTRWPLRGDR